MQHSCNRLDILSQHIKSNERLIIYQSRGNALTLTLNRPSALNSLNLDMIIDISSQLQFINQHQVVWFQGAGGKALCAGGDVKALFSGKATVEDRRTFFREEFILDYRISSLNALQISCWDGIVMGGGVGLTAFAPFVIATEKTLYAMPQAKLGFFTDVGVNYLLARLKNNLGYYLGMTGSRLKGQDAFIVGLANYYIPSEKIPLVRQQIIEAFSQQKQSNPSNIVKQILNKYHSPSGRTKIENQDEIKQLFGLNSAKQIYLKSKSKDDPFHCKIAKLLDEQCPVSVQLIFALINIAKQLTLRGCFIHDYKIIEHIVTSLDFSEGVRTVLVEKGAKAIWSRSNIMDVQVEDVARFLTPIKQSKVLPI